MGGGTSFPLAEAPNTSATEKKMPCALTSGPLPLHGCSPWVWEEQGQPLMLRDLRRLLTWGSGQEKPQLPAPW